MESLYPTTASTVGGTVITVTGRNFGVFQDSPCSMTVGGVEWTNCSRKSNTEMACVSLAGGGSGHEVHVTVDGQSSAPGIFHFGYECVYPKLYPETQANGTDACVLHHGNPRPSQPVCCL